MGSGASCEGRSATPPDERLRTMLILRAYNCRPRDWTMKDQFDAVAENGVLTKDRLRKALQLSECPRIEALLDRCMLNPVDSSTGSVASISVAALIAFVEAGSRNIPKVNPAVSGGPHTQNPPPPPATLPAAKPSVELQAARSHQTSGASDHATTCELITAAADDASPTTGADEHAGSDKSNLLSPRVVPLTSKSELFLPGAAAAAADPKSAGTSASVRGERKGVLRQNSSSSGFGSEESKGGRHVGDPPGKNGGNSASDPARDEYCTTLVRHLGTVLGPRGKDAHRRPGPCQPVWRKRETLIQERIVQYTTVDEEGTVQELFETEKSQTEVLHMECKRTGEFAHSESTHYESGETFNGEVVLEEAGVERYVHLRSVDDEYEHLESTLPPRARHGAAGAEPTRAGSEDCDKISETNEGGGDGGGAERKEGNGNYAGDADAEERSDINNEDRDGRGAAWQQSCFFGGVEVDREVPPPSVPSGGTEATPDDAEGNNADTAQGGYPGMRCAFGDGRYPSPCSPSLHHYRSPSCSPRLSPRPARSPYRQEGVGGKESSGRGPSRRSASPNKPDHENAPTHVSGQDDGVGHDEARLGRAEKVSGGEGDSGIDTSRARTKTQEGEVPARPGVVGSYGASPMTMPIRLEGAVTCSDVGEAQPGEVNDDDARPDLHCDTMRFRQSIAESASGVQPPWVDTLEGLFADTDGYGDGGCRQGVGGEEPLNSGSCGYSESAVFFGDHSGRGGDGEHCRDNGEEWRRTDSGSALRGVEFSFGREDASMVLDGDRQVDVLRALADMAADGTSPTPCDPQQVDSGLAGSSATDDDIPNLIEGLRVDAPPAISASSGEAQVERQVGDENFKEQQRRGSGVEGSRPGDAAKSEPSSAPAPFHSHDWGVTASP